MGLERPERALKAPIVFRVATVSNRMLHSLIRCYHFYPQPVDNYGMECLACTLQYVKLLAGNLLTSKERLPAGMLRMILMTYTQLRIILIGGALWAPSETHHLPGLLLSFC